MKDTGIVRSVDELGRVVIPSELRKRFHINIKDELEFFTEGNRIILQKGSPSCIFCNTQSNIALFGEQLICEDCIAKIKAEL